MRMVAGDNREAAGERIAPGAIDDRRVWESVRHVGLLFRIASATMP